MRVGDGIIDAALRFFSLVVKRLNASSSATILCKFRSSVLELLRDAISFRYEVFLVGDGDDDNDDEAINEGMIRCCCF